MRVLRSVCFRRFPRRVPTVLQRFAQVLSVRYFALKSPSGSFRGRNCSANFILPSTDGVLCSLASHDLGVSLLTNLKIQFEVFFCSAVVQYARLYRSNATTLGNGQILIPR